MGDIAGKYQNIIAIVGGGYIRNPLCVHVVINVDVREGKDAHNTAVLSIQAAAHKKIKSFALKLRGRFGFSISLQKCFLLFGLPPEHCPDSVAKRIV